MFFLDWLRSQPRRNRSPVAFSRRPGVERLEDRFAPAVDLHLLDTAQFSGIDNDRGRAVATDAAGNTYITGDFNGTVDFDPGPGTFTLGATNPSGAFIVKLDPTGALVYAKEINGPSSTAVGHGIAVDASGNVLVTGYFTGTVDLDPGTGVTNRTASGTTDGFVVKLDASGAFVYAAQFGGASTDIVIPNQDLDPSDVGLGIAVDSAGSAYVTGRFRGTADFDPSAGGTFELTATGDSRNTFVLKLNASGGFVYAAQFTGANSGNGIAVDSAGAAYVTGSFVGTTDFDPSVGGTSNLTSALDGSSLPSLDAYAAKLDASGNFAYAVQFGGAGSDSGSDIDVDASGNAYVTGNFQGVVDFDPGAGTTNLDAGADGLLNGTDAFIVKLNATGGLAYATQFGGAAGAAQAAAIDVDSAGEAYVTGLVVGTANFGPSTLSYQQQGPGGDGFVIRLGAAGAGAAVAGFNGNDNFANPGRSFGLGIAVDALSNVHVTGVFNGTVDFDPDAGTTELTSLGNPFKPGDVFFVKLGESSMERFVRGLYQDLLGRTVPPEQHGAIEFWVGVGNTQSILAVTRGFVDSEEYRTIVIRDLYQTYLGRALDEAGRQVWLGVFNQGGDSLDVTRGLVLSTEYYLRNNNDINQYFADLYNDVLGRGFSPADMQMIQQGLASGLTREQLSDRVLFSRENYGQEVQDIFMSYLNRTADPAGEQAWVNRITAGEDIEDIVAAILGDPGREYFTRVTT